MIILVFAQDDSFAEIAGLLTIAVGWRSFGIDMDREERKQLWLHTMALEERDWEALRDSNDGLADDIYVAFHASELVGVNRAELIGNIRTVLSGSRSIFQCVFSRVDDSAVWQRFCELKVALLNKKSGVEEYDRLAFEIRKGTPIPVMSHLKHTVSHVFSPLCMDLQRLKELSGQNRYEYVSEMIESIGGRKPHYMALWADLIFLMNADAQANRVAIDVLPNLSIDSLPLGVAKNGQQSRWSLSDLVDKNSIDPDLAAPLRKLCGLGENYDIIEAERGPDATRVINFLRELDRASDANSPGQYLAAIERKSDGKSEAYAHFLQWFDQLIAAFDRLRCSA